MSNCHCERSEAIQLNGLPRRLRLLAMTEIEHESINHN